MGFKLPRLTAWIGVPPYAGMEMECWLNPTNEEYQPPAHPQEWDREGIWRYARIFLRLRLPAELSDTGDEEVIELGTPRAVWELMRAPGCDPFLFERALGAWSQHRHELLDRETKNS